MYIHEESIVRMFRVNIAIKPPAEADVAFQQIKKTFTGVNDIGLHKIDDVVVGEDKSKYSFTLHLKSVFNSAAVKTHYVERLLREGGQDMYDVERIVVD